MPRAALRRCVSLLCLAAAAVATAQELKIPDTPEILHIAPAPSERFPASWYTRQGDGTDVLPAPVLDQPYTAIVETETLSQSPSGERERQVKRSLQARDRFGRSRTEFESGGMTIAEETVKLKAVTVSDPVSHCEFNWTELMTDAPPPPELRVAIVSCGPQTLRYKEMDFFGIMADAREDGTSAHGDTVTQSTHLLPLQIDGLTIRRLRVTNTRRDEKGQEKQWSSETWYSPELHELIRIGSEESGYEMLTNIVRRDPDPKLFYPPDGFRIERKPAH